MDEEPDEMSPQILHRKSFLRAYLKKLCSDPTQMEFWEYLDKVGYVSLFSSQSPWSESLTKKTRMMHTGIGRTYPLHIEYIHIGAGLAVIQDILSEAILSHPRLHIARKIAIVKALGKVIWIQNDLFTKWYVHDGEEFTDGMDYGAIIEKEGWLHGKKVLSPEDEVASEASDDTACPGQRMAAEGQPPAGVCPFTGMVAGMKGLEVKEEQVKPKTGGDGPKPAEAVVDGK